MDLKLDFPSIEFGWEGFGSKSFPKEPSLPAYTCVCKKHMHTRIHIIVRKTRFNAHRVVIKNRFGITTEICPYNAVAMVVWNYKNISALLMVEH